MISPEAKVELLAVVAEMEAAGTKKGAEWAGRVKTALDADANRSANLIKRSRANAEKRRPARLEAKPKKGGRR